MNLLRPITIFIAITVSSCMFSFALGKSDTVIITEGGWKYSIGFKINDNADYNEYEKMKDKSGLDTNSSDSVYRYWYVHDNDGDIHSNCNKAEKQGKIFPGRFDGDVYDKNTNYDLLGKHNNNYTKGSTTVCIVYTDLNTGDETWTWLGSWKPSVKTDGSKDLIQKLKIYDVADPTDAS